MCRQNLLGSQNRQRHSWAEDRREYGGDNDGSAEMMKVGVETEARRNDDGVVLV